MTYSNSTWQNRTFDAARSVARGDRSRLFDFGMCLGLFGYTAEEGRERRCDSENCAAIHREPRPRRFLCNFGLSNPDEAGNPLFQVGDRGRWYMLQPFSISLLMSKGIPMLWQGEEFGENYFLPDVGAGRVALLRPLRWDYFYDGFGQPIVGLVRKLLRIRANRNQIRRGSYFFFNDWERYQRLGVLALRPVRRRELHASRYKHQQCRLTVPFWFPLSGDYAEETSRRRARFEERRAVPADRADDFLRVVRRV